MGNIPEFATHVRLAITTPDGTVIDDSLVASTRLESIEPGALGKRVIDTLKHINRQGIEPGDTARVGQW